MEQKIDEMIKSLSDEYDSLYLESENLMKKMQTLADQYKILVAVRNSKTSEGEVING